MNTREIKRKVQLRKRKERIRKLIIQSILLFTVITGFTVSFASWLSGNISLKYEGDFSTYIVSDGDRLWNIAEDVSTNRDVREVVYIIEQDNNLDSANLHIGQELKIRNNY